MYTTPFELAVKFFFPRCSAFCFLMFLFSKVIKSALCPSIWFRYNEFTIDRVVKSFVRSMPCFIYQFSWYSVRNANIFAFGSKSMSKREKARSHNSLQAQAKAILEMNGWMKICVWALPHAHDVISWQKNNRGERSSENGTNILWK